jgi:nucleotide-binding universal stress UspA family protein
MKTVLAPFHDDDVAEQALAASAAIARRFGSYVEGLFVRESPQVIVSDLVPSAYIDEFDDRWRQEASHARVRFERGMGRLGVPFSDQAPAGESPSCGWREAQGLESEVVGDYGRLFDLIVIARSGARTALDWNATCEGALFESGRPVLVAGRRPVETMGEHVVIAWNGSTETARTIALAMPILKQAKNVTVLTVEGGTVAGPSGEQVRAHLMRHGLNVSARTAQAKGRSVGETILAETEALGADLLIKGAYTQHRLRQMIFGGATRHILSAAEGPVLLAH